MFCVFVLGGYGIIKFINFIISEYWILIFWYVVRLGCGWFVFWLFMFEVKRMDFGW